MKHLVILLLRSLVITSCLGSPLQGNPDPENSEVVVVAAGDKFLRWQGQLNRTYFIQCSDPNFPLQAWDWMPDLIELGSGIEISHEILATADKAFFKLWHSDLQPPSGVSLEDWDADGDGLPNAVEISASVQTNPLKPDTDDDGLLDGFEYYGGLDPRDGTGDHGAAGDPDEDGLTNIEEALHGTDPNNEDSDDDGFSDGDEISVGGDPNLQGDLDHLIDDQEVPVPAGVHQLVIEGDADENIAVTSPGPKTIVIPTDGPSYLLMVAIDSDEFPKYTRSSSQFNDIVSWDVTVNAQSVSSGSLQVNDLHSSWLEGVAAGRSHFGWKPVHYADIKVIEADSSVPVTIELSASVTNIVDENLPSTVILTLVPIGLGPEVLAVNSDFDEGRVDPVTGYAIPDCSDDNLALEATRDHLNGLYLTGDKVVDDMHTEFFGINPTLIDDDFWDGASVTIRKIDKIDPRTGHPESGQIRLYGKWGEGSSEYRAIIPYDFDTLATVNLVTGGINNAPAESVYGSNSSFPDDTDFFLEGVQPGKITLEWRYQKGDLDLSAERAFDVYTEKTSLHWRFDLAYKVKLETDDDPSGQINIEKIPLSVESYGVRMERASEYYDFYQDCFLSPIHAYPSAADQVLSWPGLARLAGSQVIGGLSDAEYGRLALSTWNFVNPPSLPASFGSWTEQQIEDIQQALFSGGRAIYKSVGWQHHAFRSSGMLALEWTLANDPDPVPDPDLTALIITWREIEQGILDGDIPLLDSAAEDVTDYEQNSIIQPTWTVIGAMVPIRGTSAVGEMFSALAKNSCTPAGDDFSVYFPSGQLWDKIDRWSWIRSSAVGGVLETWNGMPPPGRAVLAGDTLKNDARRFSLVSGPSVTTGPIILPSYPGSPPITISGVAVHLPVLVWDHLDVP